ncbi:hypothetical protein OK023_08125 [Serratia sp. UGAL515B_01]|nr:hypothetical protein OK023_08125 [Serratia sp. UGAL515B_01]
MMFISNKHNLTYYLPSLNSIWSSMLVLLTVVEHQFERVINLGAQAKGRYSLAEPLEFAELNVINYLNIL